MRGVILAVALAACAQPAPAPPSGGGARLGPLTIENAVARPPLGGQTTGVAYMTVRNAGSEADRLIAASSPAAAVIELHTHRRDGAVMRMERVEGMDVPAGGAVTLEPHGLHLMLFGFAPSGAVAPVTLTFERAGAVTVDFAVAPAGAGG